MGAKHDSVPLGLLVAAVAVAFLLAGVQLGQGQAQPAARPTPAMAGQATNQNPMKQMMQSMMSGVVPPGIKSGDLPDPNSAGAKLMATYCLQCHNLPSPLMHSAAEWPATAKQMFQRMSMCEQMTGGMMGMMMRMKAPSATEQDDIVAYLQRHALKSIQPSAIPSPTTQGALLFAATCSRCHALPDPKVHTAEQWPATVARMEDFMLSMGKTGISSEERNAIVSYLAEHARR